MTYQGKKCIEMARLMRKKSVSDEESLAKPQRRGTSKSARKARYIKRHSRKILEGLRIKEAASLREEASVLLERAKIYESFYPEETQRLTEQAKLLNDIADWAIEHYTGTCATTETEYFRYMDEFSAKSKTESHSSDSEMPGHDSVVNFMGGVSYNLSPLETLKMISASSIFGEPQYYRDGEDSEATILDGRYGLDRLFAEYSLSVMDCFQGKTTSQVMEKAIDDALSYDFGGVLEWAVELRKRYMMRLNPQIIMVRAAKHPAREAFTAENPGKFAEISQQVMSRGDDVINQLQYWLHSNGSKRKIPAILKRSWAKNIGSMSAYSMSKYCHAGIGLVDAVRICHAKGSLVDTLMREGRVPMPEGQDTWERLRSTGKSWEEIIRTIRIPHMALLRNLRGIFSEVSDENILNDVLESLKAGVPNGKQFPFRYFSAWRIIRRLEAPWVERVKSALEECMNISCRNLPKMPGRCAFLSDNSGSALNTHVSEYGSMNVAAIGNLSAVIGAMSSHEGVVFPFGDGLLTFNISKDTGILEQLNNVNGNGRYCGTATENGVWLFFDEAIHKKQHWDNIFIYSDMQAGHGGLYGMNPEGYRALGCCIEGGCYPYIDVNKLVKIYRERVNPKVNVYCIQTAGYTNVLVPEYGYRTAILYGWTGKELIFADALRRIWDKIESARPECN
ncbi:MAG: TROVE domain-containing protein [Synergistaceae bacterium]|nr:TROVE domain-containing protein [Synergistaceae bacterium]